ncbi:MAG: hypothetical protein J7M19_04840 [Planctomycetes bacterium]|nr:hypothetical protein [Planctomycetota bacterium]
MQYVEDTSCAYEATNIYQVGNYACDRHTIGYGCVVCRKTDGSGSPEIGDKSVTEDAMEDLLSLSIQLIEAGQYQLRKMGVDIYDPGCLAPKEPSGPRQAVPVETH